MTDTDTEAAHMEGNDTETDARAERLMVARGRDTRARTRVRRGPVYSGSKGDWEVWSFQALAYLDDLGLKKVAQGRDNERKNNDDANVERAWKDDNEWTFNLVTAMVDNTDSTGKTLLQQIMNKFKEEQPGDKLWDFLKERATKKTVAEIDELKRRSSRRSSWRRRILLKLGNKSSS